MPATIPASQIVSVIPGVVGVGGSAIALTGLILTQNARVPVGTAVSFPSALTVAAYFGPGSQEASMAAVYFAGYDGSTVKPASLLFMQYAPAAVAGYLRGGPVGTSLTLAQLQTLSGVLTVSVDGTARTSNTINLAAATSFSNAAALIQAGFASLGATVSYDSVSSAFVFTSASTGATSSVGFASGTLAAPLLLTQATGAVISAGAIASTPATAMASAAALAVFASFTTTFEPVTADKVSFAAWANGQNNAYAYIMWSTDVTDTTTGNTASATFLIKQLGYSGTVPIYEPTDLNHAAFVMGQLASLDFARRNGRATSAFRSQAGLAPGVTDAGVAANLKANGLNYYGAYALPGATTPFFYPGAITGKYLWLDSYACQIQLTSSLQSALLALLTNSGSIPYNATGYAMIEAACADTIDAALRFGSIRAGVTLSASQAATVNAATGLTIDSTITQRGWYIQVSDPPPSVRVQRGSPVITLFYADGQSVQQITLNSLEVQ